MSTQCIQSSPAAQAAAATPELTCRCGRAKPACADYCKPCRTRWARAGYPPEGPPAPLSPSESGARGKDAKARLRAAGQAGRDDAYDRQWARDRHERRIVRAHPAAVALTACVAARDCEGIRLLLHKAARQRSELLIVLAELASPRAAAEHACDPEVRAAAFTAHDLALAVAERDREACRAILLRRARSWAAFAAVAVVLAASPAPAERRAESEAA